MSVVVSREPDGYVDVCLGRVCDVMGIKDEGRRAALPAPEIHVDWEEPPGTLRLPHAPPHPASPPAWMAPMAAAARAGGEVVISYVPPPPPTVRVPRPRSRATSRLAVFACALVSTLAVGAAYFSASGEDASRAKAALATLASR